MRIVISLCSAAWMLLALSAGMVSGQDAQSLVISSNDSTYNYLPSAAANTAKGSVLAAWAEYISNTDSRIVTALCKSKPSGYYSVGKRRYISQNSTYNSHPYTAYHPDLDEYLVVWHSTKESVEEVHDQWICCARFNAKGKQIGSRVDLNFRGGEYSYPVVIPVARQVGAPDEPTIQYLLLMNHYPLKWEDREDTGLFAVGLGQDCSISSPLKMVRQGKWEEGSAKASGQNWYYGIVPNGGCASHDGKYLVIGLEQLQPPYSSWYYDAVVMSISPDGSLNKWEILDSRSAYYPLIRLLPKNRYFATWHYESGSTVTSLNRKLKKTLKPGGPEQDALKGGNISYSSVVNLGADPGLYQISATAPKGAAVPPDSQRAGTPARPASNENAPLPSPGDASAVAGSDDRGEVVFAPLADNAVYGRYVKPNAKLDGLITKLFSHGGEIQGLTAVGLPGDNRVFVIWSDGRTTGRYILRGYIFTAR